ncbi:hypothetical protein BDN71DRAFT_175605 [Pleurotus eryngii]|uniref:Uncharacterized protein n=1 Tax=Pleurotus eryngii TaxID=5323 RepID=A0A9P6A705_PLEER|nr:hypothetical protein BDN71DRAFT_175605 [Pleurotus eryngii]
MSLTLRICRSSWARDTRLRTSNFMRSLSWFSSHASPLAVSYAIVAPPRVLVARSPPQRSFSMSKSLAEAAQKSTLDASSAASDVLKAFSETTLFRKLADDPEALKEMAEFVKLLKSKGIDPTSGKTPGTMQMLKLVADPEFREAAKRTQERLLKSGVDLKSPEIMAELMALKKS